MKSAGFHILRVGTAVTFLWIGILILQNPESWAGMILPWVQKLLPFPVGELMFATGILDIVVGVLLLVHVWTWFASFVGTLHLIAVLAATGINTVTIRDVGLLTATIALFIDSLPEEILSKIAFWREDRP